MEEEANQFNEPKENSNNNNNNNSKKTIKIVVISLVILTLIIAGILAYTLLKPKTEKCGDGICDSKENAKKCPQDCKSGNGNGGGNGGTTSYCGDKTCNNGETCSTCSDDCGTCSGNGGTTPAADSPFGAHGQIDYSIPASIGVEWQRIAGPDSLAFGASVFNFESALKEARQNNLGVIVTVHAGNKEYPADIEGYKQFLRDSINKYKNDVQYYQIENEPDNNRYWEDTPENYAKLLKDSYVVIKEECADCKVVIGGAVTMKFPIGDTNFYDSVLSELKSYSECSNGCYDIFDIHAASCDVCLDSKANVNCDAGECSYGFIANAYNNAKNIQAEYGFNNPIWSTEFGYLASTIETTQKTLIKSFVYALNLGFEKLFWRVAEDCCKIYSNEPTGTYYAYKTLIEQIKGYSSITKITDSQYKFSVNEKNIYILWCDSGTCALPSEITGSVKVTDFIGIETTKSASSITLNSDAIFLEQA